MKFRVLIVSLLICAVGVSLFGAGSKESQSEDHFVIQSIAGDASYYNKSVPAMAQMDLEGWWVQNLQAAGIDFYIFKLEAGAAEMGIHGSPDAWLGYILSGSGELSLGDSKGNETEKITFTEGDFLVFQPDAMHGWRNGDSETKILFLKKM